MECASKLACVPRALHTLQQWHATCPAAKAGPDQSLIDGALLLQACIMLCFLARLSPQPMPT